MSKIKTQENLIDALSEEIAWRKKEISFLRFQIDANNKNSIVQRIMIRSAIPILYSHWEGFIKYAAGFFLQYIANNKYAKNEVILPLHVLSLKRNLNSALQNKDAHKIIELFSNIITGGPSVFQISYKTAIETEDNLDSNVLKRIIVYLNFDYSVYETKEKLIDDILLYYRNNIVHGKDFTLDHGRYKELQDEIVSMLENFKTQIENAVVLKSFLKK